MQFEMSALGWSPSRAEQFEPYAADGLAPARVAAQHRGGYVVYAESGERPAEVAAVIVHLLSPDAAYVSSTEIAVDGGLTGHGGGLPIARSMGSAHPHD